jgi:hypothetical protein
MRRFLLTRLGLVPRNPNDMANTAAQGGSSTALARPGIAQVVARFDVIATQ